MTVHSITTSPFADQRPGTSGLRKRTTVFQQTHYLENFVQALLDVAALPPSGTLVVGGDGRYRRVVRHAKRPAHSVQNALMARYAVRIGAQDE